jgi:hypothetical protein
MLDIHEDLDCALIDNREEYGSSSSLSKHSFEDNANSEGVFEFMDEFDKLLNCLKKIVSLYI